MNSRTEFLTTNKLDLDYNSWSTCVLGYFLQRTVLTIFK